MCSTYTVKIEQKISVCAFFFLLDALWRLRGKIRQKMNSPIGARRMKTDLHTDAQLIHTHFASRAAPPSMHQTPHSPMLSRRAKNQTAAADGGGGGCISTTNNRL